MLDDESRAILGMLDLAILAQDFLEEAPNHESGLSPRQMHKLRPDIDIITWMQVGTWLFRKGKVRHGWRPLKQPDVSAQESVYTVCV